MKILKKINKGLILTIIVLAILFVYLVNLEIKRNAEKPEIERTVKEYIGLLNKYEVLPEDMQKIYKFSENNADFEKINKENEGKLEVHLKNFEEELKGKMIDNKTAIEMQKNMVKDYLEESNNFFNQIVVKNNKEILKIRKYAFDENQVTITLDIKSEIETKYMENDVEKLRKNSFNESYKTITLKYVDGTWKIVYSDIGYNNSFS